MMEQPLTSTALKSIDNMIYSDTDSIYTMKTKLNSIYGKAVTNMNKSYITIMVSGSPVIVFKQHIVSIEKKGDKASIYCSNGEAYDPSNKYIDIVKQILD